MRISKVIPTCIGLYLVMNINSYICASDFDDFDPWYAKPTPVFYRGHVWDVVQLTHSSYCNCECECDDCCYYTDEIGD